MWGGSSHSAMYYQQLQRQSTTPSGIQTGSFGCSAMKSAAPKGCQWTNSAVGCSSASTAVPSTTRDSRFISGSHPSSSSSSALFSSVSCSSNSSVFPSAPSTSCTISHMHEQQDDTHSVCSNWKVDNKKLSEHCFRRTNDMGQLHKESISTSSVPSSQCHSVEGHMTMKVCNVVQDIQMQQQQQEQIKDVSCQTILSQTPVRGTTQHDGEFEFQDDGYIVTPGKHRIHINSFLMQADMNTQDKLASKEPAIAAMASYAQDIYSKWRLLESLIDKKTFQLSFHPGSDIERFRQMALHCILQYVRDAELTGSTAHCSIHNVHRVLLYYVHQIKVRLTANMFFGTIAACLRMALKHEEVPEKVRPFRDSPGAIWQSLGLDDPFLEINTAYLNKVEVDCLNILKDPLTPPSGPDYLDRYLTIGGWPDHLVQTYREIALYLINLSLFSRREIDQLAGLPPSLIAASALALGIKVISAGKDDGYEFWPQRLVVYSRYSVADLRPGVRGLSALLRSKPTGCDVLEHFHPIWARFDWK